MRHAVIAAVTGAALCIATSASAKSAGVVSYPYDQVYPSAVRFLRIDERLTIIEKDSEAGYILFEIQDDGKTFQGSFEVARVRDQDGRNASKVIVRIEDRPLYMEQGLIDRFGQKLYDEHGDPKPPPPRKTKKTPPKQAAPDQTDGAADDKAARAE